MIKNHFIRLRIRMNRIKNNRNRFFFAIIVLALLPLHVNAQFSYKWMSAGALHNWFSEAGCEIEEGRSSDASQQDGLQWPAIFAYQDCQAAKGLWMGARNFTDEKGDDYSYKVVHVGPRTSGVGEVFPVDFRMISKFPQPIVTVDGVVSTLKPVDIDEIDENMPWDRMIINTVNSQLGLTMTRKVIQFSHPQHDNYMVYDYTFTNTGNVDNDSEIELDGNDLDSVYFFFQYRYAINRQIRYLVHNSAGWGKNTMNDARGDGLTNPTLYGDPADENIRTQYAWHGYHPEKEIAWDNIGVPIFWPDAQGYISATDTVGRLGAPQFVGIVTIHADKSAEDPSDDWAQPTTTVHIGSDIPRTKTNDPYNETWMKEEYEWMKKGHMARHARLVQPDGDYAVQKAHPVLTSGGGYSSANGYGPYSIKFGQSVHIVMAEGAAGLSTKECIRIGGMYMDGLLSDRAKNEMVLTGKDSLIKTFKKAIANYESDYSIDQPPFPPKSFTVEGGGDKILLTWEVFSNDPNLSNLAGFRIYRNAGEYNNPLRPADLVYVAGRDERSFEDFSPVRGVGYYYYIEAFDNNGLNSSRYYTQTVDAAFLTRPQGDKMGDIRVVPNPYIISSSVDRLRFNGETDKLAFFNIPGKCRISIFTENGELVKTIIHTDGSGDESWNAVTSSNQLVVSGIYIAFIEVTEDIIDQATSKKLYTKGQRKIVKFVIVR